MSEKSSQLILITGGTGFIGFQVTVQLLEAGYPVRAVARGQKVARLRKALARFGNKLEVVELADLFSPALDDALKGVYGVIHVASLMRPDGVDAAFKFAIDGSIFMLDAAVKAGVKKFVCTSSTVTYRTEGPYGPNDFNTVTKEDAIANSSQLYVALKIAADKAVVEYSTSHPEIDISLIGPDFTYGPLAEGFEHLTISETGPVYGSLSTTGFIWCLLDPNNTKWFPHLYGANDVRDSARAHVLALESPPIPHGIKRFPIVTPDDCSYKKALEIIAEERPELKGRLVKADVVPSWPEHTKAVDRKRIAEVIGLKEDAYTPWRKTILDTVDSLVKLEEFWKAQGFEVAIPDQHPLA